MSSSCLHALPARLQAFPDSSYVGRASVLQYSCGRWRSVGYRGLSPAAASSISLAASPVTLQPLTAWVEGQGQAGRVLAARYLGPGPGSTWGSVVSAGAVPLATGYTSAGATALAFAPNGTPFLSFSDAGAGGNLTVLHG